MKIRPKLDGESPPGSESESSPSHPKVEMLPISALRPYPGNARHHSDEQVSQIAISCRNFGWIVPIIVDAENTMICGHGRLAAAKRLSREIVPVIRIEHLTEAQVRAYRLADNKIAENAEWDDDLLRIELQALDADIEIDVGEIGFEAAEIDLILSPVSDDRDTHEAVPEPVLDQPSVAQLGDLWQCDRHRLLCGDALDLANWSKLMGSERAQEVITDPPYNVRINGNVSGLGQKKHREFAMASGEMSPLEFTEFLRRVFKLCCRYTVDGSIHYICMDWRHIRETLDASDGVYTEQKNLCVWAKTNAGMGSFYRSQHELVFVFKSGAAAHINNFGLGATGRHRSNLWTHAGVNTFRQGRDTDLEAHPTVKPVAMVANAIMDCSKRGGIVLDPFAGSGTTLIACEETGRSGYGMEIDPHYVDLIIRRLQKSTGKPAVLCETGETFDTVLRRNLEEANNV